MRRMLRTAAAGALAVIGLAATPAASLADAERIREKALELEQKLNRHLVEVYTRGQTPKTARVYKDFDFILKPSKVEEALEGGQDFHSVGLANFLTRAIVESELASYEDDLMTYLQTTTVDVDGKPFTYSALAKQLALSADGAERRRTTSLLGSMVETSMIFRNDIAKRRVEAYRARGFADYAEYYAKRQGLDLDALKVDAESVLTSTQALYETLLADATRTHLGSDPRQVKYQDLAYLTEGAMFADLFPGGPVPGMKAVYAGLGVDASGLVIDAEGAPGQPLDARVLPVMVPAEVHVLFNPVGGAEDAPALTFAVGEALLHARASDPGLEGGYLANEPAAAAAAWIPAMVFEEPGFLRAQVKGDDARVGEYLKYRAFVSLYQLRTLAGLTVFEIDVYRGEAPERPFRDHFGAASGLKITMNDAHRGIENLSELRTAARFRGMLAAAALRDHLKASLGDAWYTEGKAAAVLTPLWSQGGRLTTEAVGQAAGGLPNSYSRRVDQVRALAAAAGIQ